MADTAERLRAVLAASAGPLDTPAPGRRPMGVDGSHAAATDHRLRVLRDTALAALPCLAMIVRDYQTGLLTARAPGEDAHAGERTLLPAVPDAVRPDDVWPGDRDSATAGFMAALVDRRATFVPRRHARRTGRKRRRSARR